MSDIRQRRISTKERHAELISFMQGGVVHVEDLSTKLKVSASTVRRDLAQLTSAGRVTRTYGGAVANSSFHERAVGDKARVRYEAKSSIAAAAAQLVTDGMTIFLDAGTTCLALAEQLHDRPKLTVMTRGLEIATCLASSNAVHTIILGGTVLRLSHGIVGPISLLALERMSFDIAFLSVDSVDAVRGIGEPTLDETLIKERVAAVSRQVFVLADSSKFLVSHMPSWTLLDPGWSLITDDEAPASGLAKYRSAGVGVIMAPSRRE